MDQDLLEAAIDLHARGHLAEAEQLYRRALLSEPRSTDARHMLGVLKAQQGHNQEARDLIAAAVAAAPHNALALENLGRVLSAMGHHQKALQNFDAALALAPGKAGTWCNRGKTLDDMGRPSDALADYDRALSLEPNSMLVLNNRGTALMNLGRYEAARDSFERALTVDANYSAAHANHGVALQRLCRFDEALAAYERALVLDPDNPDTLNNRGVVLQQLGQLEAATQSFARAERLLPEDAEIRLNQAIHYLLQQDFKNGWPLFEVRKETSTAWDARSFPQPLWTGAEDIDGKTLFVYVSVGLGDAIQFYRYALLAQARGARVILSVNDSLLPLLQSATPAVSMIGLERVPECFDYHIPLMSMPLALGIEIPDIGRYLAAEPARVARWRDRLGTEGYRIAIAWQGSAPRGAEGKSFPVAELARIAALPGIRLINLQKNAGTEQLEYLRLGMTVETFAPFDDGPHAFLDSAAILENCHLLISCDTGLAHLAGALGVPNWIALKFVPEWRWFLKRSDTPWYSKTRLFRQASPGDWNSVFRAMEAELLSFQDQ